MGDWTDEQNDAVVADYFAMLAEEVQGLSYNKAEHNRALKQRLGRSRGSIEFKHQNISAVLESLGEDWIDGYKPRFNFQDSLLDAVVRWLDRNPSWISRRANPEQSSAFATAARENSSLWVGPPPTRSNAPPPKELDRLLAVAARFDVAGRDARNKELGRAGEERVLAHEDRVLRDAGRPDLAKCIRWVSELDGDGAGYDIRSFEADGSDRLIEVKTTNGRERTPFFLTRNELLVSEANPREWCLLRLWHFSREPRAFELRPPLDSHVSLIATNYRASFP